MIAGRVAAAPGVHTAARVETHEQQVGRKRGGRMEGACNTLYPSTRPPTPARARARYGSGSGFLVSVSWLAVARNHGWCGGWAVERCINGGDTYEDG